VKRIRTRRCLWRRSAPLAPRLQVIGVVLGNLWRCWLAGHRPEREPAERALEKLGAPDILEMALQLPFPLLRWFWATCIQEVPHEQMPRIAYRRIQRAHVDEHACAPGSTRN